MNNNNNMLKREKWSLTLLIFYLLIIFAFICSYLIEFPHHSSSRTKLKLFETNSLTRSEGKSMKSSCPSFLMSLVSISPTVTWPPPCPIPEGRLRTAFEGPNGSMPITRDYCLAQRYEGAEERVLQWSENFVNNYCAHVESGTEIGSYSLAEVGLVRLAFNETIGQAFGSIGLVMGSELPWVECLALSAGAKAVWTFEYGNINSTHPRMFARPYKEMAAGFASGTISQVDWIATFSSLEHSGLGRYGDPLNPDGDKEALQQAWCMLKPGGTLILGIPMSCQRNGFIEFNAHRFYGFERLAHISSGYQLIGFVGGCDIKARAGSIVLLRKPLQSLGLLSLTAEDFEKAAF